MIKYILWVAFAAAVFEASDAKNKAKECAAPCGKNSQPGCGTNCGRKCSDYPPGSTRVSFACPDICRVGGCDCDPGYVWDGARKGCVEPNDCSIKAVNCTKKNEIYAICPAKCPAGVCGINDLLVDCAPSPQIGDAGCASPACKCKFGFYRNDKRECVEFDKCPTCADKPNEEFNPCWGGCPPKRCDIDDRVIRCAAPPTLGDERCIAGCQCKDGFKRNANGTCVPQDQCPAFCYGENEEASTCINGGCYGARFCSQKGRPTICVDLLEGSCRNGCLCKKGYLREENTGFCVIEDKCPAIPTCKGKNQIYDYCPAPCPPRKCSVNNALIKCAAPPRLGDPECQPGCRCADGFKEDKNGECIAENQCDPFCYGNEEASNCTNGGCFNPKYCSKKDEPYKCVKLDPESCKKGCLCKDGLIRDELSGECVTPDKCPVTPKCDDQNQVFDYCPYPCPPRRCDVNDALISCVAPPQLGDPECEAGCRCQDGYKTNSEGLCVLEKECPAFCGTNEEPSDCIQGGCYSARNCSEIGDPIKCAKIPQDACIKGCLCVDGYLRDDVTNECIPENQCPEAQCNGKNEVFDKCISPCISRECGKEHPEAKCEAPQAGSPECEVGCRCADGFKRSNGICVPENECPDKRCTRANEIYVDCPDCSPQTCETINKKYNCQRTKNTRCKGSCRCKPGFYRNKIGDCISKKNCLKCTGKHEFYSCGGACDNVCETLSEQNQTSCPIINIKCNEMCYCESGHARNKKGICIPIEDCPKPPKETCLGPNEFRDDCAPQCSPQSCQNVTVECLVQAQVCRSECRCKEGYFRDNDNLCVTRKECETCKGPNESYNHCAPQCSPQGCNTLVGPTPQCLPIAPGQCWGACRCNEGYYRDDTLTCIPKDQCQLCTAENEVYNECTNLCTARSCSDLNKDYSDCVSTEVCQPNCVCKEGYYRDDSYNCIPKEKCPRCNGRNEVYNGCAPFCTPRNCSELDKDFSDCVSIAVCEGRCVCEKGYYRNDANGTCVSFNDCPCTVGRSFKSSDGCNSCTCSTGRRGQSACTLRACLPAPVEDVPVSEAAAEA